MKLPLKILLATISLFLPLISIYAKEQILPTGKIYCVTETVVNELLVATEAKDIDAISNLLLHKKCFVTKTDVPFLILSNKTSIVEIEMYGINAWIINPNYLRTKIIKTPTVEPKQNSNIGTTEFKTNINLGKSVWTYACKTLPDFTTAKMQQGNKQESQPHHLIATDACPMIGRNRPIIFLGLVQRDIAKIKFLPTESDEPNIKFNNEYFIGANFIELHKK